MTKKTIRLTMAQALTRYLASLKVEDENGQLHDYVGGVWAIFGHGNVCGLGEALSELRLPDVNRAFRPNGLPVYRGHNEQGMAHAAIAYGKAHFRQRIMAATSSIGPGATNMVTAAALAYVNRLPLLLLTGDIFVTRNPDPVLQQSEDFSAGDTSVNDCFRPVSRYFDRITHPAQLLSALPRAVAVLTDPVLCGPVTLSLPQDVQAWAYDYPEEFFNPKPIKFRRLHADAREIEEAITRLKTAKKPLIIAGGGVLYSQASAELQAFAEKYGIPVTETQAGHSALPWHHRLNAGAIGVSGVSSANVLAQEADLIIAVGTRLQDFTTASNTLFSSDILALNVSPLDITRRNAQAVLGDARLSLKALLEADLEIAAYVGDDNSTLIIKGVPGLEYISAMNPEWTQYAQNIITAWQKRVTELTTAIPEGLPYDAEVIGAVRDSTEHSDKNDVVVCAAGTLPAELHKLWRADGAGNYHMDYGYSCMGYEIAGALGVKLARLNQEVIVMLGDGSYLMLNSELAIAQMLGLKIIVVVLDNQGYGCINRLQRASGSPNFNNLLSDCVPEGGNDVRIDFAMHAKSLGAHAEKVADVSMLKEAMKSARQRKGVSVIVIDTTPERITQDGGAWWEVGIPEVSNYAAVNQAHAKLLEEKAKQK